MSKETFEYFVWLRSSLDNSPSGASSKKLAAFWVCMFLVTPIVITWAAWAFIHNDWKYLNETLDSLLFFMGTALTINGAEKVISKFKKPTNEDSNSNSSAGTGSA